MLALIDKDTIIEILPDGIDLPPEALAQFSEVPDHVVIGSKLTDGEWVNPTADSVPLNTAPSPSPTVPITVFWRLWSIPEWLEAESLADLDRGLELLFKRLNDVRTTTVDLDGYRVEIAEIVNALTMIPLAQKGIRLGQILDGIPV